MDDKQYAFIIDLYLISVPCLEGKVNCNYESTHYKSK